MFFGFEPELLLNVQQFSTIENEKLPPNLSRDEVLHLLQQRAIRNRTVMQTVNALIDEHLQPVFQNPYGLSDEEADAYAAFADKLFSMRVNLDMGLSYPIHMALLKRARKNDDIDRIVYHSYWCGLISHRWDLPAFSDWAEAHFLEAVSFLDRYAEIENKQTRMTLNRCLGNVYVAISSKRHVDDDYTRFFEAVDRALRFWGDPKVQALDPDFPWDAFVNNSHQNVCSWLDRMRTTRKKDRFLAKRIYESTKALYHDIEGNISSDPLAWSNSRTVYCIAAAKYHAGYITAAEITRALRTICDNTNGDDYSEEGVYRNVTLPGMMLLYMEEIEGLPYSKWKSEAQVVFEKIFAYCKNMPADTNRVLLNRTLSTMYPMMLHYYSMRESIELLLRMTTFSHVPTHAHSVMTSKLMHALAQYFLAHAPEKLIGLQDTATTHDVKKKRDAILDEISLAGLAHDAGKTIYIHTVSLSSRRLTDAEFDIIKEHTNAGHEMFSNYFEAGCVTDVILGHHKWYDGTRGYPVGFDNTKSKYRFVIDMASVADSIDAATDSIGRSYANQLTLDDVIREIQEQAGTRYNPEIAAALDDRKLRDELADIVINRRKDVYYAVYLSMQERLRHEEDIAEA